MSEKESETRQKEELQKQRSERQRSERVRGRSDTEEKKYRVREIEE